MPKLKDYLSAAGDYFSKNYGLNSVTAAVVPAVAQVVAVGSPAAAAAISQSFDPATVNTISHGGAAAITVGIMVLLRIFMALGRV